MSASFAARCKPCEVYCTYVSFSLDQHLHACAAQVGAASAATAAQYTGAAVMLFMMTRRGLLQPDQARQLLLLAPASCHALICAADFVMAGLRASRWNKLLWGY